MGGERGRSLAYFADGVYLHTIVITRSIYTLPRWIFENHRIDQSLAAATAKTSGLYYRYGFPAYCGRRES